MGTNPFRNAFRPRRNLGRTGFCATQLGIGDVADRNLPIEECVATVQRAMDAGLNVIDTAPGYEDGYSEEIVGKAVRGRREGIFVIDKVDFLDRPVAPQIDQSLRRLRTDVDLFVLHGVSMLKDWTAAIAPGGAMEQLQACRKAGKMRWCGISSHNPRILRKALWSGTCDVIMFPVGAACDPRYINEVLPLARSFGVGSVCSKTFGAGKLLADTPGYNRPLRCRPRGEFRSGPGFGPPEATHILPHMSVADCLHYTMTCDPDVAVLGLSFPHEQDVAFRAALDFKPLSPHRMEQLRAEATEAVKGKGVCWWNPRNTIGI